MAFSGFPEEDDVSAPTLLLSEPSSSRTTAEAHNLKILGGPKQIIPLLQTTKNQELLQIKKKQKPCNLLNHQLHRELMGMHTRKNLFLNTSLKSRSLYCLDVLAHHDCIQAFEFSDDGKYFASASLDMCLFLWKMEDMMTNQHKPKPTVLKADYNSNVFCLAFGPENDLVFTGSDEKIIIHDTLRNEPFRYIAHDSIVLSLGLQPFSFGNVFASGCSDGKLRLFDLRCSTTSIKKATLKNDRQSEGLRSVMFSPVDETLIAVTGASTGTELIDVRQPEKVLLSFPSTHGSMNARFNAKGNRLLCIENKKSPVIYDLSNSSNRIQLQAKGYRNYGTPKSVCFAGKDDELAVAGSNDHNVYIWSVPSHSPSSEIVDEPLLTLHGHRSIVNHVRYNSDYCVLASCGPEKMIKLWSPVALPDSIGGLDEECATAREPYKSFYGLQSNSHSTDEDQQMLAFFDIMESVAATGNSGGASYQRHLCMGLMEFLLTRTLASMEHGDTDDDSSSSNDAGDSDEDDDEHFSESDDALMDLE